MNRLWLDGSDARPKQAALTRMLVHAVASQAHPPSPLDPRRYLFLRNPSSSGVIAPRANQCAGVGGAVRPRLEEIAGPVERRSQGG